MVASYCYESPKPAEFGVVGLNWDTIGWRVRVNFTSVVNRIRPKDHIDLLKPMLPSRYSPLQESGNGIQSIYLTEVPDPLARTLIGLIGSDAETISGRAATASVDVMQRRMLISRFGSTISKAALKQINRSPTTTANRSS
jgi:hypothetical protein